MYKCARDTDLNKISVQWSTYSIPFIKTCVALEARPIPEKIISLSIRAWAANLLHSSSPLILGSMLSMCCLTRRQNRC
jgi:hypothetical protein